VTNFLYPHGVDEMRIEIHVLQNFAPSNLNRDDTGSPKDAEFGGYRRARVSSQCLKRAVREFFREHKLIDFANLGERTKRLAEEVSKRLIAKGRSNEEAVRAAKAAVSAFLPKSEDKDEHKTPYLLFLGETEIERFAAEVEKHWDAFSAKVEPPSVDTPAAEAPKGKGKGKGKAKASEGLAVPDGFTKAVEKLLDGGKAADLALFGRMLADLPENNVDAACQVAHALSTNKIHSMEMDYFTAVDDLKPDDTAGADMIGTVGFNSACYYRYANLDVGQLKTNLQGDAALTERAAAAFLKAFVHAVPNGKQNTFAAHNPPSLVFVTVRSGGPVSLANAFVKPVMPRGDESLINRSIAELDRYYGQLVTMYGDSGLKASAVCQLDGVKLANLKEELESVEQVIAAALSAALPSGGEK
jgi:CRISPR system Cascade subunit CasC